MSSPSPEYVPPRKSVPKINPNIIIPAKYNELYERFAKAIDDIHTSHAKEVDYLKRKIYDLST